MQLKLNGDQVLSLGNYALAGLGAALAGWGLGANETHLATGMFAIVMSFGIAIWMNGENLFDVVTSLMRRCLMVLGIFGVAKGWISETTAVTMVNSAMALLPVVWAMWFYRDEPGPNLPGTTIVDVPPATKLEDTQAIVAARAKAAAIATLKSAPPSPPAPVRDGPALP